MANRALTEIIPKIRDAWQPIEALLDRIDAGTSGAGHYYADGKFTLHAVTVPIDDLRKLREAMKELVDG